jgi:hypothetical protein
MAGPILVECPRCGRLAPESDFGQWLDSNEPPTCCTAPDPQRRLQLEDAESSDPAGELPADKST